MLLDEFKAGLQYSELDPNIVKLVRTLNSIPWIATLESCGGHPHPQPGQAKMGEWMVVMRFANDAGGWAALSFLTYLQGATPDVWLFPQFFVKESYQGLAFVLAGKGDPRAFADVLAERIPEFMNGAPSARR